jgi:hypothetical protein
MGSDVALDERAPALDTDTRVLFLAWQNPETRLITPVGRLRILRNDGESSFEFRYLAQAKAVLARPLTSFPDFDTCYTSTRLFPLFENRMIPRDRVDFADWAASLGLSDTTDPFEVLAQSGGTRATDTLEVFPEPTVDHTAGVATLRFLVRGVRYRQGANDEIDRLHPGDRLDLVPEPDNEMDRQALLVVPATGRAVGWVPAYLCPVLHRSALNATGGQAALTTTVRHIGERTGPSHFRLLCDLTFPWPYPDAPFDTPEFAPLGLCE